MYRVHDAPDPAKLAALQDFLEGLGIHGLKLSKGQAIKPRHFGKILAEAAGRPEAALINELVLRSQAQAVYAPENLGHFGLALRRYAHFTSPIRRYADLLVHRALIKALLQGAGGIGNDEAARLPEIAQQISQAERRAMAAERETADRLVAAFLAERVGAEFDARVSGVTKSGLFVRLHATGADGFVPAAGIGRDDFRLSERDHALIGARSGEAYRLGDAVRVRLVEAIPSAGALRFEMLSSGRPPAADGRPKPRDLRRGRKRRGW